MHKQETRDDTWRQQVDEDTQRIRKQAQSVKARVGAEKDITKKVRLIMNLIAPDTFDKKIQEIKDLMFKRQEEIEQEKEESKKQGEEKKDEDEQA